MKQLLQEEVQTEITSRDVAYIDEFSKIHEQKHAKVRPAIVTPR